MKILSLLFFLVGIGFCIVAYNGHSAAWAAAALCFFAVTMLAVRQRGK